MWLNSINLVKLIAVSLKGDGIGERSGIRAESITASDR